MTAFQIAWSETGESYRVHKAGCKHLMSKKLEIMAGTYEAATGAQVAEQFAAENEGCWAVLGPCAK